MKSGVFCAETGLANPVASIRTTEIARDIFLSSD
jgi:hypothetical protein